MRRNSAVLIHTFGIFDQNFCQFCLEMLKFNLKQFFRERILQL